MHDTITSYPMEYAGNIEYEIVMLGIGFGEEMRCVISDHDYALLREGLPAEKIVKQILFDTEENEQTLAFSNELYKQFALRMSENMNVGIYYNAVRHEIAGDDYGYAGPAVMFLYVAVICMATVGIIAYTRSQSVGIGSKQVFDDLKKLGADNSYLRRLLKAQVKKVYLLPTSVGCAVMLVFETLMLYTNDGRISSLELTILPICFLLTLVIVLYQYLMYRISLKKTAAILV